MIDESSDPFWMEETEAHVTIAVSPGARSQQS
jgi:hypothetical protein